ncbi:unnamed protein product [Amoebophrya sp. A120]|nr:unnamed protein product [Amoebophrya sp. A120]|eukprot:GSA120T00023184001.1
MPPASTSCRGLFRLSLPNYRNTGHTARPFEQMAVRAVRAEARLKRKGITKYNKRFRAWSQKRVRKYNIALPVVITSDPQLMDAKYLTACVHKAAQHRKHDIKLWDGFVKRLVEIANGGTRTTDALLSTAGSGRSNAGGNGADAALLTVNNSTSSSSSSSSASSGSPPVSVTQQPFDPVDWGYLLWSVGKAGYLSKTFFETMRRTLLFGGSGTVVSGRGSSSPPSAPMLPNLGSYQLMSLFWCCKRLNYRDVPLQQAAIRVVLDKLDDIRPADFVKIINAAAALDVFPQSSCSRDGTSTSESAATSSSLVNDLASSATKLFSAAVPTFVTDSFSSGTTSSSAGATLKKRLFTVCHSKLDACTAQEFRDAVNPCLIGAFFSDELIKYTLTRFRKIHITARPHHLLKAFESAVVCRTLYPHVWVNLDSEVKQFYVKLSMRHIPCFVKSPDAFHWNVSKHLSQLEQNHRNAFRWGPFWLDIGLESLDAQTEKRDCILLDRQPAFYFGTNKYIRLRKLQHKVLTHLGWNVKHVRYEDWFRFKPGSDSEKKQQFLLHLLAKEEPTEILLDKKEISYNRMAKNVSEKKGYLESVKLYKLKQKSGRKVELSFD